MSCSLKFDQLLHKYIDHDLTLTSEEETFVKEHLTSCRSCYEHFHELDKAIALVQSISHCEAPTGFTEAVMKKLPKEKRVVTWRRWIKGHPFAAAVSLFLLLMMASIFSAWSGEQHFSVTKQSNLIVENSKVIVPQGETIKGDVIVENGNVIIEGTVEGNVTVINGESYMAAAGQVTGEIKVVDEIFEWVWYHIKSTVKAVMGVFR